MQIKVFQLHKRSSIVFSEIQDKYSSDSQNRTFALADGATQGFKSEIWAQMLTDVFVENPTFKRKELIAYFTSTAEKFSCLEHCYSENFAIKAVEKRKQELGSFATFVGVQLEGNMVNYISSGDICLFILRDEKFIYSYPFSSIEDLDADKGFLSTIKLLKNEVDANTFYQKQFDVQNNDTILLTTDAIARYFLKSNDTGILFSNNFKDFKDSVVYLWENKVLEEDDISIITIKGLDQNTTTVEEVIPPTDFAFPKEESQNTLLLTKPQLTFEQMKEIQYQIEQLKYSIEKSNLRIENLHKKVKFLRLLSLLLFGLFFLSSAFLVWKNITNKVAPKTTTNKLIQDTTAGDNNAGLKTDRKKKQ